MKMSEHQEKELVVALRRVFDPEERKARVRRYRMQRVEDEIVDLFLEAVEIQKEADETKKTKDDSHY